MQCLLSCAFMHALCCFSSISCFRNKWESCSSVNRCGNFSFSYPFGRRDCGDPDFQLRFHPMDRHPMLHISGNKYQIMEPYILGNNSINHSIMIAIDNFKLDKCKVLDNYTQSWWYGSKIFQIAHGYTNLTLWRDCNQSNYLARNMLQMSLCGNVWYYSLSPEIDLNGTHFCKTHLQLPIKEEVLQLKKPIDNKTFPWQGFEIRWHVDPYRDQNCGACSRSNGICGFHISKAVLCYCRDGTSQPDKCHASPNLTPSSGKSSSKLVPILLGSIGGAVLVVVMCLILFCRRIRQRKNYDRTDENLAARGNFEQFLFDYEVLREATGNFDGNNMLGKGGYGEVYKGSLPDGTDVAVKKLNGRQTTQAAAEFLTEVKLLTSVRHRNLVRLLGCCTRGHERLLVYEFMSQNSLHKHLFGEIQNVLSWQKRLGIIVGTARGLTYLHEESNVRIIHRDIKCGNILLDDRFRPKIADFGLARFFPDGETHVSTRVGGTIGYTAPEYAVHGRLTEKADVYSYGIVVLEIVSGRKSVNARLDASMQLLLEWAWKQFHQDQVLDIVDSSLEGQYPREQVLRVIRIALLCTQGSRALRPAMSEVVSMLTNNSKITVQPTQPAFIDDSAGKPTDFTTPSDPVNLRSASSHGSITVSLLPR